MKRMLRILIVLMSILSFPEAWGIAPEAAKRPTSHPYLYADKARFKALSKSRDGVVSELRTIVLEEADKAVVEMESLRTDITPSLGIVRSAQGRLLNLSAAYQLSGGKKYAEAAKRQISTILDWKDWGTYHFLDIGEAAFAIGVAYDWLYPVLTREEKRVIEQALVDKVFTPYFLVTEETGTWLRGDFNWNQVCHGGVAVAALAIYDTHPDLCRQAVERAVECVPYAVAVYAPDGAYPEGPSYWEYGTTFQVLLMEALRSFYGHCFGLEQYEGFLKTADFRQQVCGNTGLEYSYSDYHKSFFNEPVVMWFARELGRYDLQSGELSKIRRVREAGTSLSRQTVFDLLWWSGLEPQSAPAERSLSSWFAKGKMPLAVMRTDKAHNDAYLAFKGGTADHSHGHMDSGSFVYESLGVRWALDPGTENYDRMRSVGLDLWNYQPESTRWTTFRPSSEAHNILRINGAPLVSTAVASEMSFVEGRESCSATLNTTSLYATAPVSSVRRTVSLSENGDLTVMDEVSASREIVLTFQWLTDADAELVEDAVRLTKDGKSVLLSSPEADSVHIEDVSSVPGIQNSPNPGVKRILFVKKVRAGQATLQTRLRNSSDPA